jgi:hypothetical protein
MEQRYNSTKTLFKSISVTVLTLLLIGFSHQDVDAQVIELGDMIIAPAPDMGDICTLDPLNENSFYYKSAEQMAAKGITAEVRTADFEIDYQANCGGSPWPAQARTAFEYALDIWGTHLDSSVPIRIEANWVSLEGNTLGSAGPTRIVQLTGGDSVPQTWYTIAQASAMTGQDIVSQIDGEDFDIVVNMNCSFNDWYFGTNANPPGGLIDFVTVILHEVGHGIGFIGSMGVPENSEQGRYGFGQDNYPIIYDRNAEDGQGNSLLDTNAYPNPSEALFEALTGQRGGIFHVGEDATSVFSGNPIPLFTPGEWNSGSSYSHVDQQTFNQTENALMRPQIERAFAMHSPGPVFCGMMSDWGWPLGGNCLALVGAEAEIMVDADVIVNGIDFGVTNVGRQVERTLVIGNEATAEDPLSYNLTIESNNYVISPAGLSSGSIPPGESVEIIIRYTPQNDRTHQAVARISHNAMNASSPLMVDLKGEALREGEVARLENNYPNPFNPTTTIPYVLPETSNVRLDVYTMNGRLVQTLLNVQQQPEGRYELSFDAANLASGVYLYRLIVNDFADTKKLLIIK